MNNTINFTQITAMLALQERMNAKVNPHWKSAGYAWLRAAMVESVEALGHHGWKWWKQEKKDLPQLQLEMVDIWHFALSAYILKCDDDHEAAAAHILDCFIVGERLGDVLFDGKTYDLDYISTIEALDLLTGLSAAKRFHLPLFQRLLKDCEMTWPELHRRYIAKNVLNFFRQDHGYKQGAYIKVWGVLEDNETLEQICARLDPLAESFETQLYEELAKRYEYVLADAQSERTASNVM